MKVSIRVGFRAVDPANPLDAALEECKELGYDGIELMLSPNYPYQVTLPWAQRGHWSSESITKEQRAAIRASSERRGVAIPTVSSDWAWLYAQFNPSLAQWDRGVELLAADVDLCADLGGQAMLMHVGESRGSWAEIRSIVERVVARGEQQPHEEIALVGKRMVALHSSYPSVQVDYGRMRRALAEVGYDWYWCFEVPWEQARGAILDYRHIMGSA